MRIRFPSLSLTLVAAFLQMSCATSESIQTHSGAAAPANSDATAVIDPTEESLIRALPDVISSKVSRATMAVMSRYHFAKKDLTNELALNAAKKYIKFLDNGKAYLLAEDVDAFYAEAEKYGERWLKAGQLEAPYSIYNLFVKRVVERTYWLELQFSQPLNLESGGTFVVDPEKRGFAKSLQELNEMWKARLETETINLMLDDNKTQEEAEAALIKRYEGIKKRLLLRKPDEIFETWMNSQMAIFDPHSSYYSPRSKEDFQIDMSLSLEGIGARLTQVDDKVTIVEIIPGGPAEKSGELAPRDKIEGVAQGDKGEMVDVIGWRVSDVVDLIRGKRGSVVRLNVRTKAGDIKDVRIVRDTIDLEAQAASSELKAFKDAKGVEHKVGVIILPAFYADFAGGNQRSSAADFEKELRKMMDAGAESMLIDLRADGGGSLDEAIRIAGLFIPKGTPVVQVKTSDGRKSVKKTPFAPIYDGPVGVLVDRGSASASEITAGVLQDLGRGLIIGQTTYGKGTVQNVISVDQFLGAEHGSQVKMTTAKFYRISGGSTQHKGVIPDVKLPSVLDAEEIGEENQDFVLPWDQISPALYQPKVISNDLVQSIQRNSDARRATDPGFQVLGQQISRFKYFKDLDTLPVSLSERKVMADKDKQLQLDIENGWRALEGKDALDHLEIESEEDKVINARAKKDRVDPILDESLRIMTEYREGL